MYFGSELVLQIKLILHIKQKRGTGLKPCIQEASWAVTHAAGLRLQKLSVIFENTHTHTGVRVCVCVCVCVCV